MASAITAGIAAFQKNAARFALKEIAPRPDLNRLDDFPLDIWQKMAEAKLLGLSVPETYGGRGGNFLSILAASESLVAAGRNMGIALSWIIHEITAHFFILRFGNEEQKRRWLPGIASGRTTACIAISEPGVGAHPKFLQTSAEFQDGRYVLRGEKTMLTNGPIADLFIVFAATSLAEGKKQYTAFLVPKETPGLSLTDRILFDFLRPCPHCGIRLSDCRIAGTDILGETGSAYPKMVIPFREIEDILLMGPVVGAMAVQMNNVLAAYRKTGQPADEVTAELGGLSSLLAAIRIAAYEAARMLDSGKTHPEFSPLLLSLRPLVRDFLPRLDHLAAGAGLAADDDFRLIANDLTRTIDIAKNIALIKQKKIGEALLSGKD